jgi:RimJ/RimL family protein N-acetyltransferase
MEFMPKRLTAEESDVLADRIQKRLAERGFGLFAAELRETGSFIGLNERSRRVMERLEMVRNTKDARAY